MADYDAVVVSIVGEPPAGVELNFLVSTRLELIIPEHDHLPCKTGVP